MQYSQNAKWDKQYIMFPIRITWIYYMQENLCLIRALYVRTFIAMDAIVKGTAWSYP